MYVLLFEDNKNVWIFQKCLHSTLVLCSTQGDLQKRIMDVVIQHEKDEKRRLRIVAELSNMLRDCPLHSLEPKQRDVFSTKFNVFKSFIYDLN